jgi:photosystem II stability/assembly factor-like uncharacterized protein
MIHKGDTQMKKSNKLSGIIRFILFTVAILSLVKMSNSQNWVSQSSGTTNTLHGVWFVDLQKGFAVGDLGTIRYTTNSGTVWQAINGVTNEDLHDITFLSSSVGIIVGDNGRVYRSTNGGSTWAQQTSGVTDNLRTVSFGANGMVYAAGVDGVIIRSTNSGTSWNTVTPGSTRFRGSSASGSKVWLVGDNGVISSSQNNGASFTPQTSNTASDFHGIYMLNELTGFAGGKNDMLLYTNNGGSSWSTRSAGIFQSVNAIHFPAANLGAAVCEAGAIYITTNSGLTWVNDNSGTATELNDVYFPSTGKGWAVGVGGVIKYRGTALGISNISILTPDNFSLSQNYPNPFNPSTRFKFAITKMGNVNISVYDVNGSKAEVLVQGFYNAGVYEVSWDASKYSSGVYFYTIETNEFTATKRMMLVK